MVNMQSHTKIKLSINLNGDMCSRRISYRARTMSTSNSISLALTG